MPVWPVYVTKLLLLWRIYPYWKLTGLSMSQVYTSVFLLIAYLSLHDPIDIYFTTRER